MTKTQTTKMVRRLNATLPDPLAIYVGEVTGRGALYETPSEFIRDLVRRHMENAQNRENMEIAGLLAQSLHENDYADWTSDDLADARSAAKE